MKGSLAGEASRIQGGLSQRLQPWELTHPRCRDTHMPIFRWCGRIGAALLALVAQSASTAALGDTITLKNGLVYHGTVDRDNTLIQVYDGLKRVLLRDSKISGIESDASLRNLETFELVQPLEVHGGKMPTYAIAVQAGLWDEFGRRSFSYIASTTSKPVTMKQAINRLGPHMVKLRGVDGFWLGQLATSQVPKPIVLGLLAKVEQQNQDERLRVGRFLIQAEWYDEAKKELERLEADFPERGEQVKNALQAVFQLEAEQRLAEINVRRKALQPRAVLSLLKSFPSEGVSSDLLGKVRDQLRQEEAQVASDKALADALQALYERLSDQEQKTWKAPSVELLAALAEAPDAVRPRLEAYQKADAATTPEARFALALSGWVVGSDAAVSELEAAERLWTARGLIADYLRSPTEEIRSARLAALSAI